MGSCKNLTILLLLLTCSLLLLLLLLRMLSPSHSAFSTTKLPQASGFEEWIFEQRRRKARIARACSNKTKTRNNDRLAFYFNEEHNLLFCFHPKVGITQFISCIHHSGWVNHMVGPFHQPGRKQSPRKAHEPWKKGESQVSCPKGSWYHHPCQNINIYFHGLIFHGQIWWLTHISKVRHPFERLVSAYQNKVGKIGYKQNEIVEDFIKGIELEITDG